jgi:hypothetical protein
VPGKIDKMGYKGVDTTELVFKGHRVPAGQILGGKRGGGFVQMMDGVEVGRVNVAARACGISIRAFELAVEYAQQRSTFGKPIAEHQAIAFKLAEMATKVEAAHLMMVNAARLKDSGERFDVESGMAKLLASEYCAEVTQESFRIHGGYGYSKAHAGGSVPADRRGHLGDPEDDHQQGAAEGVQAPLILQLWQGRAHSRWSSRPRRDSPGDRSPGFRVIILGTGTSSLVLALACCGPVTARSPDIELEEAP